MELTGKKVNFLGDSITAGAKLVDLTNRYDNVLKNLGHLECARNYGVGGTRIALQTEEHPSSFDGKEFYTRAEIMDRDADIVVIFGGTNDYGHGDAPFGTLDDTEPTTFCGAVNHLIGMVKRDFPSATIVFMTPMRRNGDESALSRIKRPLVDYVDAIISASEKHGIYLLDLYRTLPINPNDEKQRALYAPDGLHPNELGQRVLAEHLYDFLRSI